MSNEELDNTIPVNPPSVNKNTNPKDHNKGPSHCNTDPCKVAIQLKILIPVGTAITIVAAVK
jgi:hypothetical protein